MISSEAKNFLQDRPRGRPTLLTPEVWSSIIGSIREGLFQETAAHKAGIAPRNLERWLQWGRQGREPYASFLTDFKKNEAEYEAELVRRIADHGTGIRKLPNWTALAWILERRFRDRWGRPYRGKPSDGAKEPEPRRPLSEILAEIDRVAKEQEDRDRRLKQGDAVKPHSQLAR